MGHRISFSHGPAWLLLGIVSLCIASCSLYPTTKSGLGMEKYAEERYAQALSFMKEGRFELAREQFTVAQRTAIKPELKALAQQGHDKAEAIIEAKR